MFTITIEHKKETLEFQVADYLYHTHDYCKFEVFSNGEFAASFEPDNRRHLHVCKNTGAIKDDVLHLIADRLEHLPSPSSVLIPYNTLTFK